MMSKYLSSLTNQDHTYARLKGLTSFRDYEKVAHVFKTQRLCFLCPNYFNSLIFHMNTFYFRPSKYSKWHPPNTTLFTHHPHHSLPAPSPPIPPSEPQTTPTTTKNTSFSAPLGMCYKGVLESYCQSAKQPTLASLLQIPNVDGIYEDASEWGEAVGAQRPHTPY